MKINKMVWVITAIGVAMLVLTFLFLQNSGFYQSMIVISLLVGGLPFITTQYLVFRRAKIIEENLPDFLRDVAESNRSGMPLAKAIETATYGSYGILSKEMKS